ncbi:MAG: PqqD family protein [Sphingomonadales bacterium]|nr:MAG: PqqD family protein [Sphingomonadales bacterium]
MTFRPIASGEVQVSCGGFESDATRVSYEDLDGEIIAIDFQSGAYYSLAGSAAEIWRHALAGSGRSAIVEGAAAASSDPDRARLSASAFLDELLALSLIRETSQGGYRPAEFPAFDAPKIEKFEDMAELIKLDPIHEVTDAGWPHVSG